MKINEKLNLVIPMQDANGETYYLHTTPLSREAFEANYLLMSQAFSLMIEQGIQVTAGPRVADLVMRDLAERQNRMDAYTAYIAEIKRITTVIKAGPTGWEPMPLSSAIARGVMGAEDLQEALSLIVFFTLTSALWGGEKLAASLRFMNGLWGSQNTSLNSTAFTDSLRTSTVAENTGETVAA